MTTQTQKSADESGFSAEWNKDRTELRYTAVAADGKTVVDTYVVKMGKMSKAVLSAATCHGIEQRTRDAGALPRGKNGAKAPIKDKMAAVRRIGDWLMSGTEDWNLPRAEGVGGGGVSGANVTLLALALVKAAKAQGKERTPEQMRAVVLEWDVKTRDAMLVHKDMKQFVDAVRAEQAAEAAAEVKPETLASLIAGI